MYEFEVKKEIFVPFIKALCFTNKEAILEVDEEGIKAEARDPGNIMMVRASIGKEHLLGLQYGLGEPTRFGADVDMIWEVVGKSLRKDDVVSVKGDERKLAIKTNHLRFGMNLLDPTAVVAPPPVPEAEYDAVVTISTSEFYRALKFAEKIAEHVWFISEKNNFYFKADGDTDRMVYQFDVVDHNKGKAKALYAVEYLDDIARAVNEVESVIISLKSDFPLSVSVEVPQIEFILAPRIEPE